MDPGSPTAPPFSPQPQFFSNGGGSMATPPDYLAERTKNSICFSCKLPGHWKRNCPYTSPSTPRTKDYDLPVVYCSCSEACVLRDLGEGQMFFCCPRQKYSGNCGYVRRRDKVWAPQCPCGAGTASVRTWKKMDVNMGRIYFECRLKKGHGACSFREWEDTVVKTPPNDHTGRRISGKSPEYSWSPMQVVDTSNDDMGRRGNFSPPSMKSLKFDSLDAEDTLPSSSIIISGLRTPEKKILRTDGCKQPNEESAGVCVLEEAKCSEVEAFDLSNVLSAVRNIPIEGLVAQASDLSELGWLGRLLFPPSRCLTASLPKPFFCCIFPNFDAIKLPRAVSMSEIANPSAQCSFSVAESSSQCHPQVSGACTREVFLSREMAPLIFKARSYTAQENWQAATCLKKKLRTNLHLMDLLDESARNRARTMLDALSILGEDIEPLKRRVGDLVHLASEVASML